MPDQNNPVPTQPSPTGTADNQTVATPTDTPVVSFPSTDSPPPPMDSSDVAPPPPITEPAPMSAADSGSAAPSFDISSSSPPPKKKFGGRRVIATILGVLVLVGGVGAGVLLVQQQQDIRERAVTPCNVCQNGTCRIGANPAPCLPDAECSTSADCPKPTATQTPRPPTATQTPTPPKSTPTSALKACKVCSASGACVNQTPPCSPDINKCKLSSDCPKPTATATVTPTPSSSPGSTCTIVQRDSNAGTFPGYCDRSAPNTADCTDKNEGTSCTIRSQCGGGTGSCVIIDGGLGANTECQCQKGGVGGAPATPTPVGGGAPATPTPTVTPRPGGGVTAQCFDVKIYDTNWTQILPAQFGSLKAGDKIRFTIGGNTSSGSFDKARFKINGAQRAEVTGKRPSSNDFYDEYTLPAGVSTFSISAQIHHSSLGWSN